MLGADDVAQWLKDGTLIHPVPDGGGVPTSVDLYRYMAAVAGSISPETTPGMARLEQIVGHADHFVLAMVDGLGMNQTHMPPPGGALAEARREEIRAVFPSTTASALTSLATGTWPAEHGVTGWWTYFTEADRVLCPLTFRERGTKRPGLAYGLTLDRLVDARPLQATFFRSSSYYLPATIRGGHFAKWSRGTTPQESYLTLGQGARSIARRLTKANGATYTYWYIPHVDAASHTHGPLSRQASGAVLRVDDALLKLKQRAPAGTRIIVVADHGQIEAGDYFALAEEDALLSYLKIGPTGEGTMPIFHVRAGKRKDFRRAFQDRDFGEHFALITPDEAQDLALFGPQALSRKMRDHLGDFIGIAPKPTVIDFAPGKEAAHDHLGVHGGLRPQEMRVPLYVV